MHNGHGIAHLAAFAIYKSPNDRQIYLRGLIFVFTNQVLIVSIQSLSMVLGLYLAIWDAREKRTAGTREKMG